MLRSLLCLFVANSVIASPKSRTFDEILSDKDISTVIGDYEVEEDDPGLMDFLLGNTNRNSTTTAASANKINRNATVSGFRRGNFLRKKLKGRHDLRDQQGFYKLGGAHNRGVVDDSDFYIKKDAVEAGDKGIDLQEEKNYRQGSKTRGYHRVLHKDEYKKDQLFYDDNDSKGSLKRFGGKVAAYGIGVGGKVHKGRFHHDVEKGVFGKQGIFDKGSFDKELEGLADSRGFDGVFNANQADGAFDVASDSNSFS